MYYLAWIESHDDTSHKCARHRGRTSNALIENAVQRTGQAKTTDRVTERGQTAAIPERHDGLLATVRRCSEQPVLTGKRNMLLAHRPAESAERRRVSQRQCLGFADLTDAVKILEQLSKMPPWRMRCAHYMAFHCQSQQLPALYEKSYLPMKGKTTI